MGQSLTQLLEQLTLSKPAWSGIFTIPAQGSFEARRQQILSYLQGTADPEALTSESESQVMDLLDKLDLVEETQRMLRAEYPAVAVLDSGSVKDLANTGENNQQLQEQMQQRFARIQAQIDELSEKLEADPKLALHLDVMVSETLAEQGISEEGRQAGEQKSGAILDWIEGEKRKDALIKGVGTAATAILGLLALISGPLGWSGMAVAGLGLGAGATGTGTALYEQPQLDVQDLGAQSGDQRGSERGPIQSDRDEPQPFSQISLGIPQK